MTRILSMLAALVGALALTLTTIGTDTAQALTFEAWPVQKSGTSGAQVTTLQYLLTTKGQSLAVDGSPTTVSKVKAFQPANTGPSGHIHCDWSDRHSFRLGGFRGWYRCCERSRCQPLDDSRGRASLSEARLAPVFHDDGRVRAGGV